MSRKGNRKTKARDAPVVSQKRSVMYVSSLDGWETLLCSGYKPVTSCTEVQIAIGVYASLIANMTIQLMQNTPLGDVRIRNGLSRKLDIEPHRSMPHQTVMPNLVRVLMTHGNQVTVPKYTREGYLDELEPLPPGSVSFVGDGNGYRIMYQGRSFAPEEVLHFPLNPDPERPWIGTGYAVNLRDVVESLRQANATKQALMQNPAPSLIVRVNGLIDDMQTAEGREKVAQQYLPHGENGAKPWLIPAEAFEITEVKPMSLTDLAIEKNLEIDKKSAAAIVGVPAFLMGVGPFNRDEYNLFVSTRVMDIARIIEQEMTRKLLIADDLYFRLNNRSLLNYDIMQVVEAGKEVVDRSGMRRNEWRDWLGLPPDPEMEELLALENYIPAKMAGQQKKLEGAQGGESDADQS